MKKMVLAALMAVLMMIGMIGCGESASGGSNQSWSSEATQGSTSPTTESSYAVESSSVIEESVATEESSITEPDEEKEENIIAEASSETPPVESDSTDNSSGIVICVQNYTGFTVGTEYALFILDPETGTCTEAADFCPYRVGDCYYSLNVGSYHQNLTNTFSRDFSKMAVTYAKDYTTERYAGWIDTEGNFFDVPKAAGLGPENEFVAQPGYYSVGFTDDGNYFVFAEVVGEHPNTVKDSSIYEFGTFYYVALDDPTTAYEGNPLAENAIFGNEMTKITAMINDTEYLVNTGENSVIKHVGDYKYIEEYISGEARVNYDGIVGPDGTFAFLSAVKKTHADTAVYITARDGSNLRRVFDCETFNAPGGKFAGSSQVQVSLLYWE